MQHLLLFLVVSFSFTVCSQSGQKYLYLNNTVSDKTTRLNLDRATMLYITEDSASGPNEGSIEYVCDEFLTDFGTREMKLSFWEYSSYGDHFINGSNYYSEEYILLAGDSTVTLPYINPMKDVNLYLTYQTPVRRMFYSFGVGLFCASVFSAAVLSPMLGMNNGTFENYNWARFGRYELFSGLGILAGASIGIIFLEKRFYFQSQNGEYPTWQVVQPGQVN